MRFAASLLLCIVIASAGCGGGGTSAASSSPKAPIANAGGPYTGAVGTAVNFSAAGSSDPQGESLTYVWNFGDNTTGSGLSTTHVYSSTGSFMVSLTVTDTSNLSSVATSTATISVAGQPPVANTGGPYTGAAGAPISFNGSGSADPQGEALTYGWTFGDGSTGTGVSPNHTYAASGTYTVSLKVTDTGGMSATAGTTATISSLQAPVANPGGPYVGLEGTIITFNGTASTDPQSETLTYAWNFGDGTTGAGASPIHTYLLAGIYTVSLTVTDTSGSSGTASINAIVTPLVGASINGIVSTGSKPISGAHVYLFAADTTGYGQPSLPLLSAAQTGSADALGAYVISTPTGAFTLPAGYSCASEEQIYLYALGGNAGAGSNASSGLLIAIGNCPSTTLSVTVNEVSTIAAAYSFSGFATDATHVSSSGTLLAQTGVANAFATASNLASLSTGAALATTPTSGIAPQSKTNTLANILASCVNAAVSCSSLLSTATSDGTAAGAVPSDTATAAINIAHHPAANISSLYTLAASSPLYSPTLSAQPNDLLLGLRFLEGSVVSPIGVAVDSAGSVWVVDDGGTSPVALGAVVKLSSSGLPLSGPHGFMGGGLFSPFGIAIDLSGNAWVTNDQIESLGNGGSITELSNAGAILSNVGSGDAVEPLGVAIDPSGEVWIAGYLGGDLVELSGSGSLVADYFPGKFPGPEDVAVDAQGNIWASTAGAVVKYSGSGSLLSGSGFLGGGFGIAIDHQGDVWVENSGSTATPTGIAKLSSSGAVLSPSGGFTGGGLTNTYGLALDGAGNLWAADSKGETVDELANSGSPLSPSTGFILDIPPGYFSSPYEIAIDPSGNVWVTRAGNVKSLYEIVGAAVPVVTPLVVGAKNNSLASRP